MPDIKNAAAAAPVKKVPFAVSEAYKNIRTNLVSIPVSYTHLDVYKRQW